MKDAGVLSDRIISICQFFLFTDCPTECKVEVFKILRSVVAIKPKIMLPHLKEFFVGDKSAQFFILSSVHGFYDFLHYVVKSTRGLLKKSNYSQVASPRPFTSLSDVIVSATKQIYDFCCQQVMATQSVPALATITALGTFNNLETFLSLDQIDDLICTVCFPMLSALPEPAFRCAATAGQSLRSALLAALKNGGSREAFCGSFKRPANDRDRILAAFIDKKGVPKATWGRLVYAFHNILSENVYGALEDLVRRRETPYLMLSFRKTFEFVYDDPSLYGWCAELEHFLWKKVVEYLPECKDAETRAAFVQILGVVIPRQQRYPEIEFFAPPVCRCLQISIDTQSRESEQIYEFFANNVMAVKCDLMVRLTNRIFSDSKIMAAQCKAIAGILENRERDLPCDYVWEMRGLLYGIFREVNPNWKFEGMPALARGIIVIEKQQPIDSTDSFLIVRWALESEVPKLHWTIFNALKKGRGDLPMDMWEMIVGKAVLLYAITKNAKVAIAAAELLLAVDEDEDGMDSSARWLFLKMMKANGGPPDVPPQYRERLRAVQRKLQKKYIEQEEEASGDENGERQEEGSSEDPEEFEDEPY